MGSVRPDPFEQFVARHGLRIITEELAAYPRDILAAPGELDRHVLVTLMGPGTEPGPVHSLFVVGATDTRPASTRDVMWWLSADSWPYERAGSDLHKWAATYGYPADDPATASSAGRRVSRGWRGPAPKRQTGEGGSAPSLRLAL
jgi:hypothetical protein